MTIFDDMLSDVTHISGYLTARISLVEDIAVSWSPTWLTGTVKLFVSVECGKRRIRTPCLPALINKNQEGDLKRCSVDFVDGNNHAESINLKLESNDLNDDKVVNVIVWRDGIFMSTPLAWAAVSLSRLPRRVITSSVSGIVEPTNPSQTPLPLPEWLPLNHCNGLILLSLVVMIEAGSYDNILTSNELVCLQSSVVRCNNALVKEVKELTEQASRIMLLNNTRTSSKTDYSPMPMKKLWASTDHLSSCSLGVRQTLTDLSSDMAARLSSLEHASATEFDICAHETKVVRERASSPALKRRRIVRAALVSAVLSDTESLPEVYAMVVRALIAGGVACQPQHDFQAHSYTSPAFCYQCKQLLWGIKNQGVRCHRCDVDTHAKCAAQFNGPCCRPSLAAVTASSSLLSLSPQLQRASNLLMSKQSGTIGNSSSVLSSNQCLKESSPAFHSDYLNKDNLLSLIRRAFKVSQELHDHVVASERRAYAKVAAASTDTSCRDSGDEKPYAFLCVRIVAARGIKPSATSQSFVTISVDGCEVARTKTVSILRKPISSSVEWDEVFTMDASSPATNFTMRLFESKTTNRKVARLLKLPEHPQESGRVDFTLQHLPRRYTERWYTLKRHTCKRVIKSNRCGECCEELSLRLQTSYYLSSGANAASYEEEYDRLHSVLVQYVAMLSHQDDSSDAGKAWLRAQDVLSEFASFFHIDGDYLPLSRLGVVAELYSAENHTTRTSTCCPLVTEADVSAAIAAVVEFALKHREYFAAMTGRLAAHDALVVLEESLICSLRCLNICYPKDRNDSLLRLQHCIDALFSINMFWQEISPDGQTIGLQNKLTLSLWQNVRSKFSDLFQKDKAIIVEHGYSLDLGVDRLTVAADRILKAIRGVSYYTPVLCEHVNIVSIWAKCLWVPFRRRLKDYLTIHENNVVYDDNLYGSEMSLSSAFALFIKSHELLLYIRSHVAGSDIEQEALQQLFMPFIWRWVRVTSSTMLDWAESALLCDCLIVSDFPNDLFSSSVTDIMANVGQALAFISQFDMVNTVAAAFLPTFAAGIRDMIVAYVVKLKCIISDYDDDTKDEKDDDEGKSSDRGLNRLRCACVALCNILCIQRQLNDVFRGLQLELGVNVETVDFNASSIEPGGSATAAVTRSFLDMHDALRSAATAISNVIWWQHMAPLVHSVLNDDYTRLQALLTPPFTLMSENLYPRALKRLLLHLWEQLLIMIDNSTVPPWPDDGITVVKSASTIIHGFPPPLSPDQASLFLRALLDWRVFFSADGSGVHVNKLCSPYFMGILDQLHMCALSSQELLSVIEEAEAAVHPPVFAVCEIRILSINGSYISLRASLVRFVGDNSDGNYTSLIAEKPVLKICIRLLGGPSGKSALAWPEHRFDEYLTPVGSIHYLANDECNVIFGDSFSLKLPTQSQRMRLQICVRKQHILSPNTFVARGVIDLDPLYKAGEILRVPLFSARLEAPRSKQAWRVLAGRCVGDDAIAKDYIMGGGGIKLVSLVDWVMSLTS